MISQELVAQKALLISCDMQDTPGHVWENLEGQINGRS